jgi:hypothetical protein
VGGPDIQNEWRLKLRTATNSVVVFYSNRVTDPKSHDRLENRHLA